MKNLLLISFFIFLFTGLATSQWSGDPNVNTPLCIATDTQRAVQIIPDGSNGAFIGWEDHRNGIWKIFIQRIDFRGIPQWPTNGIQISTDTSVQRFMKMVSDNNGGVYLTWVNSYPSGNVVYAQKISHEGNLLWSNKGIPLCTLSYNHDPFIISFDNANIMIVWKHESSDTNSSGIYCQKISNNGSIQWGTNGKMIYQSQVIFQPISVNDKNNGAIIIWEDWRNNNYCIYAQRINNNGDILWNQSGVQVTIPASSLRYKHRAIQNEKSGAIVVWENGSPGYFFDIYAQNLDSNGNRLWNIQGVPIGTQGDLNIDACVIPDDSGGAIVGWNYVPNSFFSSPRLQRVSSSGSKLWGGTEGISLNSRDSLIAYLWGGIVSDGNSGVVIVPFDARNGNYDVFGYKINSNGLNLWDSLGVPVCTSSGSQLYSKIITTVNGYISVWEDKRNGNIDIYCQKVNLDGTLTVGIETLSNEIPSGFSLSQNFPNPFNPSTKIKFDIPSIGFVSLKVYNSLGQEVAILVNEKLSPGGYEYTFDGSVLSSGVYFYRLQSGNSFETMKMILLK